MKKKTYSKILHFKCFIINIIIIFAKNLKYKSQMQKKDKNNFIVRPNGEETRKCPHCHTEVEVQTRMCPTCNYSLHWMKSGQNISVDFLQSPLPRIMTICAIIVAVIGQLFIYFLDSSVTSLIVCLFLPSLPSTSQDMC